MKTSVAGRAAITQREGCILRAYRDSRGIPTIGVGHVDMTPPRTVMGMVITKERADELLAADLGQVEAVIDAAVTVPMTQNEFDAMASLGFNIGVNGLRRSSVIRKLNLGDVPGAADAFMAWSKPAVLIGRRKAERKQFLALDAPESATPTGVVLEKRAGTLRARADTARASSKTDGKLAAGAAAAAAAIVVAQPAASHHHGMLWIAALAFGAVAIGAVVTAVASRRKAIALAANADAHAEAAAPLSAAGTTKIADHLEP